MSFPQLVCALGPLTKGVGAGGGLHIGYLDHSASPHVKVDSSSAHEGSSAHAPLAVFLTSFLNTLRKLHRE